jgi:hypothetical protein
MSLIVEDGTGLATAESYISVADATTRQAGLGNTNWALLTATEMEQALRRATVYMEQAYRDRWAGVRLNATQALSWPRWDVWVDCYPVAPDAVPADIANVCADLALKAAAGDLNADLTREVIRKKIGPLETEYAPNSPQAVRYRAIDMALAPYLNGSGVNAKLVRS